MKKVYWVLGSIIVILIFAVSFFAGRMMNSHPATNNTTQTSTNSNNNTNQSSTSANSDDQLEYNSITPMQTAAAIAYYGQHEVKKQMWKDIFDGSNDLDIYQKDNADGLNVKGRNNSWMLHPSDEGGGHMATYTIGSDGTVAFYDVSAKNKNKDKDPYTTVNLRDIINYVNEHGAVNQVKAKAQHIHLQK